MSFYVWETRFGQSGELDKDSIKYTNYEGEGKEMTEKITDYTYEEKQNALDEAWEIMNPKVETDAERLKHVMQNSVGLTDNEGCFADVVQLGVNDYAFLIEQAEENKRLREALEYYADDENWYTENVGYDFLPDYRKLVDSDGGDKARQALEVSKC